MYRGRDTRACLGSDNGHTEDSKHWSPQPKTKNIFECCKYHNLLAIIYILDKFLFICKDIVVQIIIAIIFIVAGLIAAVFASGNEPSILGSLIVAVVSV